jgi:cyanophycinase
VSTHSGTLIIIGGHEDTEDACEILRHVARVASSLVLMTVATEAPAEMAATYQRVFQRLGVKRLAVLDIRIREHAYAEAHVRQLESASVVFFTGGDQLRSTSQFGDSPLFQMVHKRLAQGATIAGTSAGAAAMPATMIVSGAGQTSSTISGVGIAPGLGLLENVVIHARRAGRV